MVYPTPGFVVKSTFLEFESPETSQRTTGPRRLHRAHSDSDLSRRAKQPQIFGSEEMRKWWARRHLNEPGSALTKQDLDSCSTSYGSDVDPSFEVSAKEQTLEVSNMLQVVEDSVAIRSLPVDGTAVQIELLSDEHSCEHVLIMLDRNGLRDCYNFVYVPVDLQTRMPMQGRALINFVTVDVANVALKRLGCRATSYQHCKSLAEFIDRYRNSPVMHESVESDCKPKLFEGGVVVPFPPPTIEIRAPRPRRQHNKGQQDHKVNQVRNSCSSGKGLKTRRKKQFRDSPVIVPGNPGAFADFSALPVLGVVPIDWCSYQQVSYWIQPIASSSIQIWR